MPSRLPTWLDRCFRSPKRPIPSARRRLGLEPLEGRLTPATLSIVDQTVTEGGTITFTVLLTGNTSAGFTVDYGTTDGTATVAGSDYAVAAGTLAFSGVDGETKTFTVATTSDVVVEANETFTVTLADVVEADPNDVDEASSTLTATGTINNDDALLVEFDSASATSPEATGGSLPRLRVLGNSAVSTSVQVNVTGGTATAGADFTNVITVTIPAGTYDGTAATSVPINLAVLDETVVEANETIELTLAAGLGTAIGDANVDTSTRGTHTYTVTNDDAATLTVANVTVNESAGTMTFTVTLSAAVQGGLTVDYATSDGSATTADGDYATATGMLTFAGTAGETKTFTVTINPDATPEPNETFTVALSDVVPLGAGVSASSIDATDTATGTISNDDSATLSIADVTVNEADGTMIFTVTLTNAVPGGFTVQYATSDGTAATADGDYATASGTLTFAGTAGETQIFTVALTPDAKVEANETLTATLSNVAGAGAANVDLVNSDLTATGTILDDDTATLSVANVSVNESAGTMTFTVTLSAAVQGGLTVNFATSDGSATTADGDYVTATGMLTFAGTAGETQTFTVTINPDAKVEADEVFAVSLSNVVPLGAGVRASTIGASGLATGTINNDDTATLTVADVTVNESAGTMTFTVTLSAAVQGGLTVNYGTTDGSATAADSDFATATGMLTFAGTAGETKTFTVTINADAKVEANETFTVALSNVVALGAGVSASAINATDVATGTISNDDSATLTVADVTVNESAGTMTFTVTLSAAVQGGLTVNFATANGSATVLDGDYLAANGTLTFAGTAGETKTFTVTILPDSKVEPNETLTASLSNVVALGAGVSASSINAADTATGTITNDDVTLVNVTATAPTAVEGTPGTAGTFTITRFNDLSVALTVTFAVSGTATNGTDFVTLGTSAVIPAGQSSVTVSVTPRDDSIAENDETVVLTLVANNGYVVGTGVATVTLTDNETAPLVPGSSKLFVVASTGGTAQAYSGATYTPLAPASQPFEGFGGQVATASGDFNGDGRPDLVMVVAAGAQPHVKVFDGDSMALLASFYAFDVSFLGGVSVAVGDFNGDRRDDLILGAASASPGGHVKVIDGTRLGQVRGGVIADSAALASFMAFPGYVGGVRVTSGNFNGDRFGDLVVAAVDGLSHVKTFAGQSLAPLSSFLLTRNDTWGAGLLLGAGDRGNDGQAEVFVTFNSGTDTTIHVFNGATGAETNQMVPFAGFKGAVTMDLLDPDNDGRHDLAFTSASGDLSHLKVNDALDNLLSSFYVPGFGNGGIRVSAT